MNRILCSICIGSLALTFTAWGQPNNDRRPDRAKAQRTSNVRAARPANTGAMTGAHRYTATAPVRQRTYMAPRVNRSAVVNQDTRMRAFRQRNFSSNRDFRPRSNAIVNRDRNTAEFRSRNGLAVNRERNLAVNRDRNLAFNRGSNFAINNNFRSAAFSGQQYAAFRNYHREWHDRGWWRSHCDRIIFVSGGWYYWNAGYWFPAWGYDPYAYYAYDGPIYAYNGLSPDQVI